MSCDPPPTPPPPPLRLHFPQVLYIHEYLHSVVEAADVLPDALASDARVALHVHEVSESKNHLIFFTYIRSTLFTHTCTYLAWLKKNTSQEAFQKHSTNR